MTCDNDVDMASCVYSAFTKKGLFVLSEIQLPFSTQRIKLADSSIGNKVSIVIGENGTRKSYLLRQILVDGVALIRGEVEQARNTFLFPPSKIIALSALPSDRFPPKNFNYEYSYNTDFDIEEYIYVGPRTARNIVSRNQSARELISSILSDPEALKIKSKFISGVCKSIGVSTSIAFELRYFSSYDAESTIARMEKNLEIRYRRSKNIQFDAESFKSEMQEVCQKLNKLQSYVANKKDALSKAGVKKPITLKVWIDLERGQIDFGDIDSSLLEIGFKYGMLKPSKILFDENKSQEDLSAGQWASFSTFSAVALSVKNKSLLLIDEPENGLHPLWQQEYIRNILKAIDHVESCHVVIATHSPLILSSLPFENSDCIVLRNANGEVSARMKNAPSGWDSNSLLEGVFTLDSPRGPEVTDLVNRALKLISLGIAKNKNELKKLTAELKLYRKNLPDSDILKEVISSIIEVAK